VRALTDKEQEALTVLGDLLGDTVSLHVGEKGANLKHRNMDSVSDLTKFLQRHGIHDYSSQALGPAAKVVEDCVIFDGRTAEVSPFSFNRAISRKRPRFWIPALARMAQIDDVLGFGQDSGLPIVVNLTGVARNDPEMRELRALISGGDLDSRNAEVVAQSPEGTASQTGINVSPEERRAMETYSRGLARAYFESMGWKVQETSGSVPYDLRATKESRVLDVEVKSSQGPADAVLLTYGEVEHAIEAEEAALFIVSDVSVAEREGVISVSGGRRRMLYPWIPANDDLLPLQYRYRVPDAECLD